MKKFLALVCSLVTVVVFSACDSSSEDSATVETSIDASTDNTSIDNGNHITGSFQLIAGKPPIPDPSPLIYLGDVELTGWIVYKSPYAGEEIAHFHVDEASLNKLPEEVRAKHQDFRLTIKDVVDRTQPISEELINEIVAASEAKSATILVNELIWTTEGSPSLNFVDIITN